VQRARLTAGGRGERKEKSSSPPEGSPGSIKEDRLQSFRTERKKDQTGAGGDAAKKDPDLKENHGMVLKISSSQERSEP